MRSSKGTFLTLTPFNQVKPVRFYSALLSLAQRQRKWEPQSDNHYAERFHKSE